MFVVAYLVGAIPFGVVVGKLFYGVDVREHGSGNVGTTNVFRVLGKKAGVARAGLRHAQGVHPRVHRRAVLHTRGWRSSSPPLPVVGHMYSVFLKGSGGKGVATGAGVVLALVPLAFLIILVDLAHARAHDSLCEPGLAGRVVPRARARDRLRPPAALRDRRGPRLDRRVVGAPRQHRAARPRAENRVKFPWSGGPSALAGGRGR